MYRRSLAGVRQPMEQVDRLMNSTGRGPRCPTMITLCCHYVGKTLSVIQNNSKSNRLEDQVFWYKSKIRDDFHMGSQEYWALSRELAAARGDDEDEEYIEMHPIERNPVLDMRSRKTGPMVTVRKRI